MIESSLSIPETDLALSLFGTRDQHLRMIRERFGVSITHRGGELRITGPKESVELATAAVVELKQLVQRQGILHLEDVTNVLSRGGDRRDSLDPPKTQIDVIQVSRRISPRTAGQQRYVDAIRKFDLTFAVGPAGTGKTYLAVASAVEALKHQRIRKLVLVRPAVEAGENLGFLPGDLQAKINPYLRPLLDALQEMIDYDQMKRLMEQDTIEVVPLAYMRGRTLNESFIILDEAQNTTVAQMKMFLTRMGEGSKIVVSGDTTQVDLPPHQTSGLIDAMHRLRSLRGVCQVELTKSDIVRHRLVQEIVRAYDQEAKLPRRHDENEHVNG